MSTKRLRNTQPARKRSGPNASLTTADLVVLSLISERAMHGYEIVKEYERQEVQDWASVSRPHVYYALQKLAERKLIDHTDKGNGEPEPRGKAVYRITRAGREAMRAALRSSSWAESRTPNAFNTWLGLAIHARRSDRERMIAARRAFLVRQIEREKGTLVVIASDSNKRSRIAAVMVGLCIEQFELEFHWLERASDALAYG